MEFGLCRTSEMARMRSRNSASCFFSCSVFPIQGGSPPEKSKHDFFCLWWTGVAMAVLQQNLEVPFLRYSMLPGMEPCGSLTDIFDNILFTDMHSVAFFLASMVQIQTIGRVETKILWSMRTVRGS